MNMYPDDDQASILKAGLAKMAAGFLARICGVCEGEGKYEQTYTQGCGMGSYRSKGMCDHCKGEGLISGGSPAPDSVINQVRQAA